MSSVPDRFDDASDALLALAIARYDQAALAETYRRHAGAVFGLARRLLVEPAAGGGDRPRGLPPALERPHPIRP